MTKTMTSRERLLAAMRFEKLDHIPVAPFGLGKLPSGSAIREELIDKTDPFIPTGVPGDPCFGINLDTQDIQDGDITTHIISTPKGELTAKFHTIGTVTTCVENCLKTVEDAEKYLSIDVVAPEVDISRFLHIKEYIGDRGLVLCDSGDPICLPANLLSPENFCLWWADYPDVMLELASVASKRINAWVDRLCAAGVDAFRIIGGEYASVQLGPKGFDALVLEQDKELVSIMHSHGAVVYYHNHGHMMRFLHKYGEIGIDALDPLEAPPWGDTDLKAAREICGNKVAFVGNLDDMEILDKLSFEEIKPMALERVEAAGDRGFILGGTASGTYSEKAARNFIQLAELMKERAE